MYNDDERDYYRRDYDREYQPSKESKRRDERPDIEWRDSDGRDKERYPPRDDYYRREDYRPQPIDSRPQPKVKKKPEKELDTTGKIPKGIGFAVVIGIIIMFLGIIIINIGSYTEPAPEMPDADVDVLSDEYLEYENDYNEWKIEKANADRTKPLIYKQGMIVYDVGVLITAISLFGGALIADRVDKNLRIAMIIGGAILLGLIFGNQSSYMNLWF